MDFDSLDRYLLDGNPPKAAILAQLLKERPGGPDAAAFYQGIELLGDRTPDLTLIALRLVLAGRKADDESVRRLRDVIGRARADTAGRADAVQAYERELVSFAPRRGNAR
jgi:hypothetical protein